MKNKYSFTAYIIMGIIVFITIIALILARININYNKAIIDRNNENIMSLVNDAVSECSHDYDIINASDEARISLDEYIKNIEKYDNVRTKANITLAMMAHVSDFALSEQTKGTITYSTNEEIQRKLAPLTVSLKAALEIN